VSESIIDLFNNNAGELKIVRWPIATINKLINEEKISYDESEYARLLSDECYTQHRSNVLRVLVSQVSFLPLVVLNDGERYFIPGISGPQEYIMPVIEFLKGLFCIGDMGGMLIGGQDFSNLSFKDFTDRHKDILFAYELEIKMFTKPMVHSS